MAMMRVMLVRVRYKSRGFKALSVPSARRSATRWSKDADRTEDTRWMEDCSVLSKKAYIEEMDGILRLMKTLGDAGLAALLPALHDHGIVNGETTGIPGPPDDPWTQFEASEFGVQVVVACVPLGRTSVAWSCAVPGWFDQRSVHEALCHFIKGG